MPVARRDEAPLGVVYTPPDVARAMALRALGPLLQRRSVDEILALRVCDPAIGEGAFLVEIIDIVVARLVALGMAEPAARRAVSARCIYGVDVDARAVAKARALVGAEQLHVADALELDWRAAFPGAEGFDVVIGNPPYVRQEHLQGKPALRSFECFDGVADLYVYFLELAHRIARPGGRYCFITPNKWLTVAYARRLRRFLAKQGGVEGVLDLARARLFDDADAFPCIVWGTVGDRRREPIRAARLDRRGDIATARGTPHDRARWTEEPWHIDAPHDRTLIDRLERTWPPLGELVGPPSRGIVTGYNPAFVIDRETRDRLLAAHPEATDLVRPLVKGRDLRRWRPAPVERYVLLVDHGTALDAFPAVVAHLARFRAALEPRPRRGAGAGRKPGRYRWFELQDPVGELNKSRAPRLYLQDIQTTPQCCLDEVPRVYDTTVWALPTADRYLLAVLNSPLYGWYARRRFPPALNGAVRPKHAYLRALPIASPPPAARAAIEQLVDAQLQEPSQERERAIADAVSDAYELSRAERARLAE